jgi:hypothetical protein
LNPFTMSQMPIDSSQRNSGTVARPDQLDVCVLPRTVDIGSGRSGRELIPPPPKSQLESADAE